MAKSTDSQFSRRERQIVNVLYRLGEASVSQVLKEIPEPPSYSAVRALLNLLAEKGHVTSRQEGKRYLYRTIEPKHKARNSALRSLVRTFFGSAPLDAAAALVDGSAGKLSADDLKKLREMIEHAEKQATSRKG